MRALATKKRRLAMCALAALVVAACAAAFAWRKSEQPVRNICAAYSESNWQRAYTSAAEYLKSHPGRVDVRQMAAESAARLGLWSTAEKHYAMLPDLPPEQLRWRINAALGLEHWSRAAELLEQLLKATPDDAQVMLLLAGIRYKDGHSVEATELAERAAALSADTPHAARAFSMLGAVQSTRGNRTVAIDYLRRALELDPDGKTLYKPAYELRHELARNLLLIGDAPAAAIELKTLLRTGPASGRAAVCVMLGRAEWCQGNQERAEKLWQQAIEHNATNADALAALGELELSRQNAAAAVKYLESAVACDPKNVVAHNWLSRAYFLFGDADAGRRAQDEAVRLRDEAMRAMLEDRVVENRPDSPDTKALLAAREAGRGNWDQAERWASEAVRLAPANPNWQRLLEQIRARQVPEAM